jgi:isocitrate dehydrogenase (NAD+)
LIHIDPHTESNEELEYAIATIKRNGVAIKGNIETKSEALGIMSRNVAIRNELDLFVNVLRCKSYPGVRSRHQDVDIVVVRQNTEGEYAMLEHEVSSRVLFQSVLEAHQKLPLLVRQRSRRKHESDHPRRS